MARSLARWFVAVALLLLAVPVVLALRRTAETGAIGDAVVVDSLTSSAFESPRADSAERPTKPKRQIISDVEVVVNIPSGRLELIEGGNVTVSYPVSVGSARYATPVGDYLLATVIFNPWWHPPKESAWARNRKPTPPGPGNPMGRVKLHMDELIYIHGTTSEGRLGAPASHGCIRMSNADVVDLARRLHRIAAPAITDGELDAMSKAGKRTRHTVLAKSVRMRVTYQVAQVRGGELRVYPDVYGRVGDGFASRVRGELARNGVDTAEIGGLAMRRLASSARSRGGASFPLADLPYLRPLPPKDETESGVRLAGTAVEPSAPRDTIRFDSAGTSSEVAAAEPATTPADSSAAVSDAQPVP